DDAPDLFGEDHVLDALDGRERVEKDPPRSVGRNDEACRSIAEWNQASSSSAARTARAMARDVGVSAWTQSVSAAPVLAMTRARSAAAAGSWRIAPGSPRGTRVPSARVPRSANASRKYS